MSGKLLIYFCIIKVFLVSEVCSFDVFHRQRRFGGTFIRSHKHSKTLRFNDEKWFTQNLDHFNSDDSRTWKQRYLVKEQYFEPSNGVAFLFIGGESPINSYLMSENTAWITHAKQFGALCFQLEHRYYGNSRPTNNTGTENIKYLSSKQALADAASFITAMNRKYNLPSTVKWIAFGGSYAGSLAAWLRLKYPNVVHGAVSSSGPVLAQTDFKDYFKVVTEALGTFSKECVNAIRDGFSEFNSALRDSTEQEVIQTEFRLCSPLQESMANSKDIENLFASLADSFANVVQYNSLDGNSIDRACKIMTNLNIGSPRQRLASFINSQNKECLSFKYDEMITVYQYSEWNDEDETRQWLYQTCTEFGYFQTSSQPEHVFGNGFPVEFFGQMCVDIFGPDYNLEAINSAVTNTNSNYGGLNIDVTNVVFIHGSIDPWHALGITHSTNLQPTAIFVQGTSHCADMSVSNEISYPQLTQARKQVSELINSWITQRI